MKKATEISVAFLLIYNHVDLYPIKKIKRTAIKAH